MLLNKSTHKNYTKIRNVFQLKLPLNIEVLIPEDDSVRLLGQIIEEMDVHEIYQSYSRLRKNQPTPRQMLKILVYAYMNRIYSSRQIELACRRDINFMYLLEDASAPDHTTIARFRSLHFAPFAKIVLARLNQLLAENGELSLETIFIDGTKIEAAANKYTFVWKQAVTKNLQKLLDKIPTLFQNAETLFDIRILHGKFIHMYHIKKLRKRLKQLQQAEDIVFVHGTGKRKSPIQRLLEQVDEVIGRLKKYTKYLHIAGKRNSFSKTDQDATFMRMKEDAMKNGQLKPAYNIQFGVDAEYVVWITAGPQPADTTTLIPFLQEQETFFPYRYKNVVADSGYESEENYLYLEKQKQAGYIKPSNYEQRKTRKYKKDIGRRENMPYDEISDSYLCANGKKITKDEIRRVKSRTGYVSEKTLYSCKNCAGCMYKAECIKGRNSKIPLEERSKHFEVAKTFQAERMESLQRIVSEEGQLLRMNRSIQSEGVFGEVKWNMQFRRFLCRGTENVLAESILLGLAHNVNKLHSKIQNEQCGKYLHPLKTA